MYSHSHKSVLNAYKDRQVKYCRKPHVPILRAKHKQYKNLYRGLKQNCTKTALLYDRLDYSDSAQVNNATLDVYD